MTTIKDVSEWDVEDVDMPVKKPEELEDLPLSDFAKEILDNKIPCVDCITLPMCKALKNQSSHPPHFVSLLINKCSIMKEYLADTNIYGLDGSFLKNVGKQRKKQIEAIFYDNI